MQLKSGMAAFAVSAGLCSAFAGEARAAALTDESTLESMFRLFTDSGKVTVRSMTGDYSLPMKGDNALTVHWNNERVTIPGIAAPPGSQAAVDAITTASRPITGDPYQDYVKVRNEFTSEYTRGHAAANYYVSSEVDYLSQQLGGQLSRDYREQTLNVAVGASYGWDAIKPLTAGDTPAPTSHKDTLHWSLVTTSVLSPNTLLRWGVEYNWVNGLQHNPYRNVYAGGTHVPERAPDERERRDTYLRLSQYLPNRSSLQMSYRLYNDNWGITSHELGAGMHQYLSHDLSIGYEYRYYTQGAAYFYRDEYATTNGVDGYLTGDYRMNGLASHLLGSSLRYDLAGLAATHALLGHTALWLNYQRYFNSNNYSANILETGLDFRFQ